MALNIIAVVHVYVTEEGEDSSKTNDQTWGDTDRDYTYDEVSSYFVIKGPFAPSSRRVSTSDMEHMLKACARAFTSVVNALKIEHGSILSAFTSVEKTRLV